MKVRVRTWTKPQDKYRVAVFATRKYAIHRSVPPNPKRWTVTHRGTGLAAMFTDDMRFARIFARVLDRLPFDFSKVPRYASNQKECWNGAYRMWAPLHKVPEIKEWVNEVRWDNQ